MSTAADRYRAAKNELERACEAAGRHPGSVRLVAVSKTVGTEEARCAMEAGALDFGENRPDELIRKSEAIADVRWHFIGNIQSRRIPDIVGRAVLIHSVWNGSHAARIDREAARQGIVQDILLEANVSGEESKGGLAPDAVQGLLDECLTMDHVRVCGLMTMAPLGDMDAAREAFTGLAQLHGRLKGGMGARDAEAFCELSMGMSDDWRIAVECGSTIVRIGRAVFSDSYGA